MAQVPDPILELTAEQIGTTYPYEVSETDAAKVYALENDLTVSVRINTVAVSGRRALFAVSDPTKATNSSAEGTNSRYVGYGINGSDAGYLASWRSGDRFTGGTGIAANTNAMIVTYVINRSQNSFRVYVNGSLSRSWDKAHADGFMEGYEIATPAMVKADHGDAKIYIGGAKHSGGNGEVFNGTIPGVKVFDGALSASQIADITFPAEEEEPAEVVVTNVEDLSNNKVYNLITTRGWLIYNSANAGVVASTASYGTFATGADVEACQWAIYKSEKNKYYLYNIGAGKFVGRNAGEGGRFPFVTEVTNDIQVVKNTTGTDYALVFSTDNYGAINHFNHTAEPGVANWRGNDSQGGLRALNDAGSAHKVVEVADIAPATLNAIAEAVAVYEADNTEAVAALDAAIANAQTMFDQITIGAGVGEYTATDADYLAKFTAIVEFRNAIQATNTPTPAEVEAKVAEVNELIASFQLNMPVAGKYYTFNNDNYYITSGTTNDGKIALSETKDATAIYYFDGTHLLAYTTGRYIGLNGSDWAFEAVGSNDISTIEFVAAANGALGKYNVKSGGRWLHRTDAYVNRCSSNSTDHATHNWTIEEVEALPVSITEAGYATFYAPVAVQLPTGVTAHTVTINGEWATLSKAYNAVPAQNGVILAGEEGSYNLTIVESAAAIENNILEGSVAATNVQGEAYVLGVVDGEVGLYKAEMNGTSWLNNSHKAYLPVAAGSSLTAAFYGLNWDGTTGVENVEVENVVKTIYDLTGRKVETISAPGIYIINGVKRVVR